MDESCPMRLGQPHTGHTFSLEGGTVCCWCGATNPKWSEFTDRVAAMRDPDRDPLTAARARIAELEATLARVRELPASWRVFTGMERADCADELEAVLDCADGLGIG